MSAAQGPSASTPLSATLSNGTEGSVYSSLMLLEAISRDATCSLHQVVKKCEWETNKGAIIAIVCVCVCVCVDTPIECDCIRASRGRGGGLLGCFMMMIMDC